MSLLSVSTDLGPSISLPCPGTRHVSYPFLLPPFRPCDLFFFCLVVDFIPVSIWSSLELHVGIICACLPSFHSLLKPVFAWLGFESSSSKANSGFNSGGSNISGGRHHRLPDAESSPESVIRVTTTVEIGNHRSESKVYLHEPGKSENPGIIEHIELNRIENGETRGSAWN